MPCKRRNVAKKKKKNNQNNPLLTTTETDDDNKDAVESYAVKKQKSTGLPVPNLCISDYDKAGVKRIFSPFTKFSNITTIKKQKNTEKANQMAYQSPNAPTGLSRKEKCYVLTSCQAKSSRYLNTKSLAAKAIQENKIFSVYGSCNAVRKALIERGWVEKIPANKMNLTKIRNGIFSNNGDIHSELERLLLSNLVEKYNPTFIWYAREDPPNTAIDMSKEFNTIVNKLKLDAVWTTKQGLCTSMKQNYWFYIDDVSEVNNPRTYSSYDISEVDEFVQDYKITACTSLLKWVISMVANDRPIFVEGGKISLSVIVFSLNRCKEYLFQKQNKDLDKCIGSISNGQWNAFLKKYYRVISKDDVFQPDTATKMPLYLVYAKFLLKEMHRYRPQLSCEGCHNIWIIKPAHCSRGRGIRMASKLGVITTMLNKANFKYVVQKYIEEPLLIHDTKFDIRQYYLVTSTYPLVIWMYKDCYLKFSSQRYNLKNFHESIHLTNNAVQRKYNNCSGRHSELPQNNMWELKTYKDYLNKIGKENIWDNIIYPGMKKSIIGIMLSCQDSLSVSKNCFELYGCDFILDKEYKPWLIEINSNPDLNSTTKVTAKICPEVLSDIIKVVIDRTTDPKAPTGKFQCIYRQALSMPRYGAAADLVVRGYGLGLDYFYRGNIELKEYYDDSIVDKERDIKTVFNKLKERYDADIMVEPEDDYYSDVQIDQQSYAPNTKSEHELDCAATVITRQLDDLLDRITSEGTLCSKSDDDNHKSLNSLYSNKSLKNRQNVKSAGNLDKYLRRFTRTEEFQMDQPFSFSKLDDGPSGKASSIAVDPIKKAFSFLRTSQGKIRKSNSEEQVNILQAADKMMSFLHEKEIEYRRDYDKLSEKYIAG